MINFDGFYSRRYARFADMSLPESGVYIYHRGIEKRSETVDEGFEKHFPGMHFIDVGLSAADRDEAQIGVTGKTLKLRSEKDVCKLLFSSGETSVYLDASGLSVRVLAPLLKGALSLYAQYKVAVYVVYAEPAVYDIKRFEEGARYNNISEDFDGLSPLPAFGSIRPPRGTVALVPMLGFEGGRFAHVVSQLTSADEQIYPIIGVSGFRPEYPFVAYEGNMGPLEDTASWQNVQFAKAGSVVDAFCKLMALRTKYEKKIDYWKIAPIGTKPHTIAALLFATLWPNCTEIVYDNPSRRKSRTEGIGPISVTCVSKLLDECDEA